MGRISKRVEDNRSFDDGKNQVEKCWRKKAWWSARADLVQNHWHFNGSFP